MSTTRGRFAPLEGMELEAAVNAILGADLTPAEFLLEERRTEQRHAFGVVVHKLIKVTRLANGKERQYSTGRGGGWPYELERDLRSGFYESAWPAKPGISGGVEVSQ